MTGIKYGVFGPREEVAGKWRGVNKDKFLVFERGEHGEDGACEAEVEPLETTMNESAT
jgi:hypothetical protein